MDDKQAYSESIFQVDVACSRHSWHVYSYLFLYETTIDDDLDVSARLLRKVGQWPSLEDIASADVDRFRGILSKPQFGELKRASGLYAHGIGIGSFVYLRRIFEDLIDKRYKSIPADKAPSGFERLRMDEKIVALKDLLPPALVKYRDTYAILSSGIHGLTEAECIRYFPAVKLAILQILEQDWEIRQRERNEKDLDSAIASIRNELSELSG